MIRRPPRSTRTDTLFPYTTLFRSTGKLQGGPHVVAIHGNRAIEQALGHFAIPIEQGVGAHFGQSSWVVRIGCEIALEDDAGFLPLPLLISEERRVGKDSCSTFITRWSQYPQKNT